MVNIYLLILYHKEQVQINYQYEPFLITVRDYHPYDIDDVGMFFR